jgi:hypothetical protein
MQLASIARLALLMALTASLSGCIPDRVYQPIGNRQPQYVPPETNGASEFGNNVVAIELHGSGKLQSCCGAAQLGFSEKLIQSARDSVSDKSKVVVITFIHGNQNNARLDSSNYPHFLQLMDCLSSGSDEYNRHMAALPDGDLKSRFAKFKGSDIFECKQPRPDTDVRYVGIYIGWRGSLNTWRADFQQRAARRVADESDIIEILRSVRNAAKPTGGAPSRLLVLGHSFGGLILERTIYHLDWERKADAPVRPFADATITVNEATGGFLAKRLIEKTNAYSIEGLTPGSKNMPARPLLITMHSKGDPLTGPFATWGRRIAGPPPVPKAIYPENDKQFIDANYVQSGDKPSMAFVRRSNPSNLLYFDNSCYIGNDEEEAVRQHSNYITGDPPGCDDVAKALAADALQQDRLRLFHVGGAFPQLEKLYRRIEYSCRGKREQKYRDDNRPVCTTDESSLGHDFNLEPWNRSADWMINMPDDVILGHGGYWQPESIELILEFARVWPVLRREDSLP